MSEFEIQDLDRPADAAPADRAAEQRELERESVRQEFARRSETNRRRLDDALAAIREPSTRTPEESAEIQARLDRLNRDAPPFM